MDISKSLGRELTGEHGKAFRHDQEPRCHCAVCLLAQRDEHERRAFLVGLRANVRSGFSRPEHFVVCTRAGRPLDHRAAARRLDAVVKLAKLDTSGLPRITPHQLRYSFGSLLIDVGESTARVSRLMGHAPLSRLSVLLDL